MWAKIMNALAGAHDAAVQMIEGPRTAGSHWNGGQSGGKDPPYLEELIAENMAAYPDLTKDPREAAGVGRVARDL